MDTKTDYIYLRAWNTFMSSPQTYNLPTARSEQAPRTATYRNHEGGWSTYEEITSPDAKRAIDAILAKWGYL